MNTAERLNQVAKELPETVLAELLDFTEFLHQKRWGEFIQVGDIAQRIHQRFADLEVEDLPIPARQLSRTPPPMGSPMGKAVLVSAPFSLARITYQNA